ncbi:hypothetical protein EMIHUDRAFT_352574 [Emiliania huxleyi CCMP1516]|uniref:SPRY domain-containing protein n=2 Tax=Emiliania huxleyi TaxID=2903 RepID=A0A0D3IXZ0_EMIH1|nr:hypothetical protein EMIHUDRAFT_370485 [Emiliania huxleyi CCMP1516]XP_005784472.1 hypothetical protein EMIHUDRAFT_352574 [Emiliania huxleyi CCMP1516]EOD16125.1 hypothetical protein EMIHUDRAFT_370485 [Emiliania huxleyi CCMP1516]EOD32043.1 hypothetical protein EMIHUDRAFT_352574 [Emiliania huxleyi CCMP1516]|mmetsp:Transcript_41144/g.132241  ORF Transcript_41144/g.132241 Transcript_41144/m.132241 type:complete len:195 (-) Transcript_41144:175-759(-)|eukprot:XP_005768554.1 hypothetical protein EMIHUDRAFT_370485 [Emiliania huxleyi CCMP1516]
MPWRAFDGNLTVNEDAESMTTSLKRTLYKGFDAALGEELTAGRHEWVVKAPNWSPNNYVGVAADACDKRTYPSDTSAWALHLCDGTLCSGVAHNVTRGMGYTRMDGSRGFLSTGSAAMAAARSNGAKNPLWDGDRVKRGTPVRVILDMEARTLSFAIGDAEPQLAYTDLPASVCPYVASGDIGERSLMETWAPQ